jgi:hypothetical protein
MGDDTGLSDDDYGDNNTDEMRNGTNAGSLLQSDENATDSSYSDLPFFRPMHGMRDFADMLLFVCLFMFNPVYYAYIFLVELKFTFRSESNEEKAEYEPTG